MTPPTQTKTRSRKAKPSAPERSQRADARRNRDAVLEAARERFAAEGLECGMDRIARTAGVGVGTVYRHFPNKEDLVHAIAEAHFARLAERAEKALAEDDPWRAFCDFMRWSARTAAEQRGIGEVLGSNPRLGEQEARRSGLADLTEQLIRKAQRAGGMRRDVVVEDVPTMVCAMGAAATAHPNSIASSNWERFLEIALVGMRAPGRGKLPPPKRTIP